MKNPQPSVFIQESREAEDLHCMPTSLEARQFESESKGGGGWGGCKKKYWLAEESWIVG